MKGHTWQRAQGLDFAKVLDIDSQMQGGRKAGSAYARKYQLSQQSLETLSEMRQQLAAMIAESRFVVPSDSGQRSQHISWFDDSSRPWNKQAHQPTMVKACHWSNAAFEGRSIRTSLI